MIEITDFQTDESDDLILNGDIELEEEELISTMKAAERRITARYDDFLLDNVGAGLERHILQHIDAETTYAIHEDIRRSLTLDYLMSTREFKTFILEESLEGNLPIIIKFKPGNAFGEEYTFRTLINQQNQRSYN